MLVCMYKANENIYLNESTLVQRGFSPLILIPNYTFLMLVIHTIQFEN